MRVYKAIFATVYCSLRWEPRHFVLTTSHAWHTGKYLVMDRRMGEGSRELIPGMVKRYPAPTLRETGISKLNCNCDNTAKPKAFSLRLLIQETLALLKDL